MEHHARETQPTDPRIGMVLQERYRIVRKLGDGGMGSVYEGEHIVIKRRVAIKILHAQFAQNPEIVARFQREAEAATSIGHANIVEVTDMGRFPDGTAYMVLEYLDGRDWAHDITQQGPQPVGKVVHIVGQVCDALDAAHAKGIVHRDLKPENIYLIERRGDTEFAKVLDFGISKIADSANQDRSLTQTGTALGTPYYMAPEQCQGKKDIDARADIYSLGVILFQALTAQYPFDDESYPMLVLKICTEPPPSLSHYRPDVPPQLQEVVNRMLAKDRGQRFHSCGEVKAALAPFAGMHGAPVVAQNMQPTSSREASVLQAGTRAPGALTPSGTAYLPNTPPPGALSGVRHAVAPTKSNTGLVLALAAGLGLLVVAGVVFGVVMALPDGDETTAGTEPVGREPDEREQVENTGAVEDPDPAPGADALVEPVAAGGPEVEADPTAGPVEPVGDIHVTILATPESARITFDGIEVPSNRFSADVARGPHRVVVSADGYQTSEETITFFPNQDYPIALQRVGGRGDRVRPPTYTPPVRPDPVVRTLPPSGTTGGFGGGTTTRRTTSQGGLVGPGDVFR